MVPDLLNDQDFPSASLVYAHWEAGNSFCPSKTAVLTDALSDVVMIDDQSICEPMLMERLSCAHPHNIGHQFTYLSDRAVLGKRSHPESFGAPIKRQTVRVLKPLLETGNLGQQQNGRL